MLEGIQDYVGDDVRVLYSKGCDLSKTKTQFLAKEYDRLSEAVTVCKHSDVVVLVLGLDETLEGEEGDTGNAYFSGDKESLSLPTPQIKLLETVAATGVPFVVCVMSGSALDLCYADEKADAILQTWYPGARGGKEVAQLLFGDYSPSGKLPVTFYRDLDGMPDFEDYSMNGRTYRFIEKKPLYPFGYGLSYGHIIVESAEIGDGSSFEEAVKNGLRINVSVSNDGACDTEDVIEVYAHVNNTPDEVLNTKLCGFKRISVAKGEKKEVFIDISPKTFETVNEAGERSVTGSSADFYVGLGQPDERTEELTGRKSVKISI